MSVVERTIQLRHYELVPGERDLFAQWWADVLVPVRVACGFRVEFGYLVQGKDEFLWAVSVEGDRAQFDRIEANYLESPERADAFENLPERVSEKHLSFVDDSMPAVARADGAL